MGFFWTYKENSVKKQMRNTEEPTFYMSVKIGETQMIFWKGKQSINNESSHFDITRVRYFIGDITSGGGIYRY